MTTAIRSVLILGVCSIGLHVQAGVPQWIWSTAKANENAGSRRWDFVRQFDAGDVSTAILSVTCDDQFEAKLNKQRVGSGHDWQKLYRYDVTQLVREKNELTIRCENGIRSPASMVATIVIELTDGTTIEIVTDDRWKCRIVDNVDYRARTETDRDAWGPVFTFGEFGKAAPWGDRVRQDTKVQVVAGRRRRSGHNRDTFELRDDDRIVLIGGTFIERARNYGHIEFALTTAFSGRRLSFRNLGWSGDTVFGESRARFGSVEDGFEHLETHVWGLEPTVIFSAYGANAAHAGPQGVGPFRVGYQRLLETLVDTGADIVLVGPHKYENLPAPLPNHDAYNKTLSQYNESVRQLAKEYGCRFVDLYNGMTMDGERPSTDNGLHLNDAGYRQAAETILRQLGVSKPAPLLDGKELLLRKIISQKNELHFHRWRPQNETYLFLFRKHEQGNNAREIPQFDPLIVEKEKQIAALTQNDGRPSQASR